MNRRGRPFGNRLREVCDVLAQQWGPIPASEVARHMDGISPVAVGKVMRKAVGHGLVDAVMDGAVWRYWLTADWREILDPTPEAVKAQAVRIAVKARARLVHPPVISEWRPSPWASVQAAQVACL